MKRLRDVLPDLSLEYEGEKVMEMLDVEVVKEHSPAEDGVRWIGQHKHVYAWWELKNGYALAWNENPAHGWSFPVKRMKK